LALLIFLTGLQVCFWLVIFKRICGLNPPEADEALFPELWAIMHIPIDTPLLCGEVVYIESKQNCLLACSIPIYQDQAKLPYM